MYNPIPQQAPLSTIIVWVSLFVAPSATARINNCFPNITEPNVPILYLDGVDLFGNCATAMAPKLHQCHIEYVQRVKEAFVEANCYEGQESVKRAMCCSLWTAKSCMIEASDSISECSVNVTEAYRALPSSKEQREHLLDQCSEYGEGVGACQPVKRGGTFLNTFVIVLGTFVILPIVLFAVGRKVYKCYNEHQALKREEANGSVVSDDYAEDRMGLKAKDDLDENDNLKAKGRAYY